MMLRSEGPVARVLKRLVAGGLDAIARRTSPGRQRSVTAAWEAELVRMIEVDPLSPYRMRCNPPFTRALTRVWSLTGHREQRLVEAPGDNRTVYGFGLVDWHDGWFDGRIAPGRTIDA